MSPLTPTLSREGRGSIHATIDIGTNTVLLLIARKTHNQLEILRDEARISRLGEGLHQYLFLKPEAQKRTLSVLKEYRVLCDSLGAKKIVAVGTAAFRKAKNAVKFIQGIEKETGIQVKIISGKEEARLSFLSVQTDFGQYPHLHALDIGGGSTELIWQEGSTSLDMGAVILTERIIRHDPPTDEEINKLNETIKKIVDASVPKQMGGLGWRAGSPPMTLIGLAGTVTTLSAIQQGLVLWDGAMVQGSVLRIEDLDKMIGRFRRTTNEERGTMIGMVKGREDTILAGSLILQKVMERLKIDRVIVSDRGLRFGLFQPQANNVGQ